MNICIFGGLGFIGSNVANLFFKKGYNVTIYTQKKDDRKNRLKSSKIKLKQIKYNKKNFRKINFINNRRGCGNKLKIKL